MAEFISSAKFEDLPPQVVHQAKFLLLDVIGCAMSGYSHDRGAISRKVMANLGGNPECTVVGSGEKTSCISAAYVNANMASALDNEETFMNAWHFSSNTVFAALALAEQEHLTGADFLTSVAIGYEVGARVGLSTGYLGKIVNGEVKRYVIVGSSSWQAMGSCASGGKSLKLSKEQMIHAFGLGGHFAPMPSTHFWTMCPALPLLKYWDNGWMAMGGIIAALLAREAYTSYESGILDGESGFWKMYGAELCDFELMTKELGGKWWIMETSFKPWPSCRYTHHPLTALSRLLDKHPIKPEEVEKITVKGNHPRQPPNLSNAARM